VKVGRRSEIKKDCGSVVVANYNSANTLNDISCSPSCQCNLAATSAVDLIK